MKELFELSFSPANVFPTILLLFVGLYWLVFLFGLLDLDFLDFDAGGEADMDMDVGMDKDISLDKGVSVGKDISFDAEVDVDADTDLDKGAATGKGAGFGLKVLRFLNLGDIPFMVFFSFFALLYWAFSVIGNHYFAEDRTGMHIAVLATGLFTAALLTKLMTQPFRKLFRRLDAGDKPIDLRGKLCVLELGVEGDRVGQAVVVVNDKHILVTVRGETGKRIERGTQCLIIDRARDGHAYLIEPFTLEE